MNNTDYYSVFRIRAFNDLTNRAKPGILIYITVWFAIAYALELATVNPTFFTLNSAILFVFVVTRALHLRLRRNVTAENVSLLEGWLVGSVLFGALHWGMMTAWVFYEPTLTNVEAPILVVLAALAMGGTSTLSISRVIRIYYPILLFLPSAAYFAWEGSQQSLMYASLIIASIIYIFIASSSSEQDYWQALSSNVIAEERALELEKLTITDPLTQIKNRMFFDTEYEKEWQRSARLKSCMSVLMIDLDFFKKLNDNYGHIFGDAVLQKVAAALDESVLRPADCVARYGGEEFIVMLPATNEEGLGIVAERVLQNIAALKFEYQGQSINVTCSIGGATSSPHPSHNSEELIKRADDALYQAKENGRNRFVMSKDELDERITRIG